jgi:hypothetical protein
MQRVMEHGAVAGLVLSDCHIFSPLFHRLLQSQRVLEGNRTLTVIDHARTNIGQAYAIPHEQVCKIFVPKYSLYAIEFIGAFLS